MSVIQIEDWIETYTIDTILYAKTWKPSTKPVATITFIHGFGEHISRYQDLFTLFAKNGIKVMSFDQRGHGKTASRTSSQGCSEGIEKTLEDVLYISNETKEPGIKHFIMGHSMGGLLALEFCKRYPEEVDGCISSAPALKPGADATPSSIQVFLIWLFMMIYPMLILPAGLALGTLTHDEEERKKYKEDPLIHGYMSVILASNLLELGKSVLESAHEVKKPVMLLHGSGDRMTCPKATRTFYDRLQVEKTLKLYDGLYHECILA